MDIKELMIGDWVIDTEFEESNKIDVVECIEPNRVWLRNGKLYTPIEFIKPIPLTAEILERNGFGYYSIGGAEQWMIKDDYYDIEVFLWNDSIWVFRYESTEMNTPHTQTTFSYVHELQMSLRFCGIEKDIIL